MADSETQNQPLLGAPSQHTAIEVGAPPPGGSSTRAYKVAGLTLLACVLIVGQGMTAYFLLTQKNDIKSLELQNNKIQTQMTNGRSGSVPMQMHVPMNPMHAMVDDSVDEEASTGAPGAYDTLTQCQQEASGMKHAQVPGFRPECDESGLYKAQQCFHRTCWCVNTVTGVTIPGTVANGQARCASVSTGGLSPSLMLSDFES